MTDIFYCANTYSIYYCICIIQIVYYKKYILYKQKAEALQAYESVFEKTWGLDLDLAICNSGQTWPDLT